MIPVPLQKSQSIRIEAKEKDHSKIMRYKQSIYQDWEDGEITHSDYRRKPLLSSL